MTLTKGRWLGPYEILGSIGAGGMGEVYRAHDSRLDRTVAIKILPAHLSERPELRQRFEREAKAIASLNHPRICVLHDIGREEEIDFLVMEYVEGETLADRLVKGPLPLDQALRYASEIADALDKAHRNGITHRDVKPANIMITKAGTKLLDFGLAKRSEGSAHGPLSQMSTDADLTVEGTILGTVQYMAPEQLEGREADSRSDVFAFGATLYEMVTGVKAFQGKSHVSLMAAILQKEPEPMATMQPVTPPALERFVRVCLAKDPGDRWQTARDLVREIQWVSETRAAPMAGRSAHISKWKAVLLLSLMLALGSFIAALALWPSKSADANPLWLSVPPPDAGFALTPALAVSPDGTQIVFAGVSASGGNSLWVRPFGSSTARELPGTVGGLMPFWKPDGRAIGFYANDALQIVSVDGGVPQVLAPAPQGIGGSWNSDGTIIFTPAQNTGLFKIPESGGVKVPLNVPDAAKQELLFEWPHFLPDGRHYLYLARSGNSTEQQLLAGSLDSHETKPIANVGSRVEYAAGYLFYGKGAELFAQPFDLDRLATSGEAVRVASGLGWAGGGNPRNRGFSASSAGVLAYTSQAFAPASQLTWYGRSGAPSGSAGSVGNYFGFVVAKDQKKVVLAQSDPQTALVNLSLFDLAEGIPVRLTSGITPLFGPDSERVIYWAPSRSGFEIFRLSIGKTEPLNASVPGVAFLQSWSSNGQYLVWTASVDGIQDDLWIMDLEGDRKPLPFLPSPFDEIQGRLSPDGRWIAYVANEEGRSEVYVESFPNPGNKKRISPGGGSFPEWRPDGQELYYLEPLSDRRKKLMAAPFSGTNLSTSRPQPLFVTPAMADNSYFRQYAAFGTGDRFLLNTLVEDNQSRRITVILNWIALMEQQR